MQYSNRIIDAAERLFRTCMGITDGRFENAGYDMLREQIMKDIEHADRLMFDAGYPSRITGMGRYALVAYADECVMKSAWQYRTRWMSSPLQLEMFGEHVAGRKFFEQISQMTLSDDDETDLLELHYVCLELGYEGSYRIDGPEKLQALKVEMQSRIEHKREAFSGRIPTDVKVSVASLANEMTNKPLWVMLSVAVLLIVLFHAGFNRNLKSAVSVLSESMDNTVTRIQEVMSSGTRGI